jgi:hypothetical protein
MEDWKEEEAAGVGGSSRRWWRAAPADLGRRGRGEEEPTRLGVGR